MMPEKQIVRIASRGSKLALAQSTWARERLASAWPDRRFVIVKIQTRGDREIDRPLPEIGGKGLFTEALEAGLLSGEVDLAVHSLKDLPTRLAEGLELGAVSERADPRDIWIARDGGPAELGQAPAGFRVGSSSERRRAQLLARRPDLTVAPIRGNVETRLRKLDEGAYGALIMAAAGLLRLGWADRVTAFLEPPDWLPAPGQGALAVETRFGDPRIRQLVSAVDDPAARAETTAERALLEALEGGCQVPVGALGLAGGDELVLHGLVALPDGSQVVRAEGRGSLEAPAELGRLVAERLIEQGGDVILERLRNAQAGSAS